MRDLLIPKGKFIFEHLNAEGELLHKFEFENAIVNEGKNLLLNVNFGATSKIATWYIGLIDNGSFSSISNTDTISSHAGWLEATGYSESVRQTWGAGTASSQSITNASAATFTISGSAVLNGIFVVTNSTKSGSTGTLWSAGSFGSPVTVSTSDVIKITYVLSC